MPLDWVADEVGHMLRIFRSVDFWWEWFLNKQEKLHIGEKTAVVSNFNHYRKNEN